MAYMLEIRSACKCFGKGTVNEHTALKEGHLAFTGSVSEVMTATVLRSIFAIEAHIVQDPLHGKPVCLSYTRLKE